MWGNRGLELVKNCELEVILRDFRALFCVVVTDGLSRDCRCIIALPAIEHFLGGVMDSRTGNVSENASIISTTHNLLIGTVR
jgi:hypothetical protein